MSAKKAHNDTYYTIPLCTLATQCRHDKAIHLTRVMFWLSWQIASCSTAFNTFQSIYHEQLQKPTAKAMEMVDH